MLESRLLMAVVASLAACWLVACEDGEGGGDGSDADTDTDTDTDADTDADSDTDTDADSDTDTDADSDTDTDTDSDTDSGTGTDEECGPTPDDVTIVETGYPDSGYSEIFWSAEPATIFAFMFDTQATAEPASGNVYAAHVPGSEAPKRVEVSLCPGGPPVSSDCSACEYEASGFNFYTNMSMDDICELEADTTYYANVYSKYDVTDTTYNCGDDPYTSSSGCAFLLSLL